MKVSLRQPLAAGATPAAPAAAIPAAPGTAPASAPAGAIPTASGAAAQGIAAGAGSSAAVADAGPSAAVREAPPAAPFLDPAGAYVMLGGATPGTFIEPLAARADTMFGPRGAVLGAGGGPLVVCDTGHHRLLLWRAAPEHDRAPADWVIGQPDFASEGRNARGAPGAATFNVPTAVALAGDVLVVADAWNHRVLVWHGLPESSHAPADVVLGQAGFAAVEPNRGRATAGADTLRWPYGVALVGEGLAVADTGNRRVLLWNRVPTVHGQPADQVLGQRDFQGRDENAGGGPDTLACGMRWPHAVAAAAGGLQIADAGNHRVLVWRSWPAADGAPADLALGQADFAGLDANAGGYWPTAATLNMPYGLAAAGKWLIAADTANSRLLAWPAAHLAPGAPAAALAAQPDFAAKGDNRWQPAARDSLCWPYAVTASGNILVIADSGNNRVVLWHLAT